MSVRDLHNILESKRQFADWIKEQIEKYDLIENVDFQVFHDFVKNPNGGRPLTEYALSVDDAKRSLDC